LSAAGIKCFSVPTLQDEERLDMWLYGAPLVTSLKSSIRVIRVTIVDRLNATSAVSSPPVSFNPQPPPFPINRSTLSTAEFPSFASGYTSEIIELSSDSVYAISGEPCLRIITTRHATCNTQYNGNDSSQNTNCNVWWQGKVSRRESWPS